MKKPSGRNHEFPSLKPGDAVGILGGGQLGRMLALAAANLGLKTVIFAPEEHSPAFDVAADRICAPYEDREALQRFLEKVSVVTYEFENVPLRAAQFIEKHGRLAPNSRALRIAQDRYEEKTFLRREGLPVAPFQRVDGATMLSDAVGSIGLPAVLKTRRFGYDGKGQVVIRDDSGFDEALALAETAPCVLEAFVPFVAEVSVIVSRFAGEGCSRSYNVCLNTHKNHILDVTRVPSGFPKEVEGKAGQLGATVQAALDYIGVLTLELFVVEGADGPDFIVNEIAPRVHNSGHWTIEGAETSQFEQHIRAVCGWPPGRTHRVGDIEMHNLIGDDVNTWRDRLSERGAHLHLYGKAETRPGRKMGHVTIVRPLS
ncbi:MAG: 5-(carboxyamino)imidazole ribonucleotide synthase [Methylobacteriaceae bacterium]|jgi:5-(carboxyamino)imidazole ribonucleotide synthase|nr:5-(carboxyamino)imidazole ribonucleotide synthase [Methylobacteriaceae bacterium]